MAYETEAGFGNTMRRKLSRTSLLLPTLLLALGVGATSFSAPHGGDQPGTPVAAPQGAWRQAVPPYQFRFPRDHASHPEFQTEWWYYTGHLAAKDGRRYGFELTFFRVGLDREREKSKSAWALHTFYFAHFAITDMNRNRFHVADKASRPALGMAGARADRYDVWIDNWHARLEGDTHRLRATAEGFSLELNLTSAKPPAIHGFQGVSQKSEGVGRASHYYSLTRLRGDGTVEISGEPLPVTGQAWMDHEFGSNQLTEEQVGWDWFSLQLEDGRELMLYYLRLQDGRLVPQSSGTLVEADGSTRHLNLADFQTEVLDHWRSPKSGGNYPSRWRVRVPSEGLDLTVTPVMADQELMTGAGVDVIYWEGAVRVEGQTHGRPTRGEGYVELTGYAGAAPGI